MEMKKNSIASVLFGWFQKLNEQRHLYSIRTAFISTMPIMIVGAFATVINQLPIPAYQQMMESVFGANWRLPGGLVYNCTTQLATLMVVFLICYHLVQWHNTNRQSQAHKGICGIVGLSCYIVLSLPYSGAESVPFASAGVKGMFVAIFTSVIVSEIFVLFTSKKHMNRFLSDDPNIVVAQAFASVRPAILLIVGFAIVRVLIVLLGVEAGLTDIVYNILSMPFSANGSNSMGSAQLFNVSTHLMWLFGIHGNNVLDEVAKTVFEPAIQQNIAAAAAGLMPPNIVTKTTFDAFVYMGGSGATLALLIALMLFGARRSYSVLFKYALPTAIFNINEPLIFGVPIVLNPLYAVPFVLTPVITFSVTMLAMNLGLVPYTIAEVVWSTPIFISGYAATGSVAGIVLQAVNLTLGVLIYAPFVKLSERMVQLRFDRGYRQLVELVTHKYAVSSHNLIARTDEVGAVARRLANQMENAVPDGEIFLLYQPIVDARSNTLHSVEALLRWNHPRHGYINPMVAITLAEETSRIDKLGMWIFEQAIQQRAEWTRQGLPGFHVSVNVSAYQLEAPDFYANVRGILEKYDVPPSQLQIEITETVALVENNTTHENLEKLHQIGVTLAMDDFGVGHSSLLYLRTQPISTLKIDGSLSRDVVNHRANLDIVKTIYDLCNLLNVDMVVEYVDNQKQSDLLMGIGASYIQGWYYSKAIPGSDILEFSEKLSRREMPAGTHVSLQQPVPLPPSPGE